MTAAASHRSPSAFDADWALEYCAEARPLIGVTAASALLKIKAPNFRRDAAPHLTAIPVEGSADVYWRPEVEALAAKMEARRASRH